MSESVDLQSWAEAVKREWLSKLIKIEPGATPESIAETEAAVSFSFPEDMRALYLMVDGFKDWDWTEGMISVWPMDRIREEYEINRDRNFVGFCDYLINSHAVGFYKDRPESIKTTMNSIVSPILLFRQSS